jgi:flagellar hook-associated protein 2
MGIGVEASVNESGDGLLITDTAGGEFALKIEDVGGTAARDLNILGESDQGRLDGSYELNLDVSGSHTLEDLMEMINEQSPLANASIMNDGSGMNPYRLTVTANAMGLAGELLVDGSDLGLGFSTLTRAQDAVVTLGNDPESGLLVTSSSNTLADLLPGLTIDLTGVSDEPVTVTVAQDYEGVVAAVQGLVSDFNSAIDRLDELGSYNPDTEERGVLQGEAALLAIENRLFRLVTGTVPGAGGTIQRLSQIGVKLSEGKLTFDEEKFRAALEADPEALTRFFTETEGGLAAYMKEQLEAIAGEGGLIEQRETVLDGQTELLNDRVDQLNTLLVRKQDRLLRQFQAMEAALAQLQTQQASLASLATLAAQQYEL